MIVMSLLEMIMWIMDTLIIFELPAFPEEIYSYLETAKGYLVAGGGIFANYAPMEFVGTLFGLIVLVDACILGYHLVMWIIKKVPFLGME